MNNYSKTVNSDNICYSPTPTSGEQEKWDRLERVPTSPRVGMSSYKQKW